MAPTARILPPVREGVAASSSPDGARSRGMRGENANSASQQGCSASVGAGSGVSAPGPSFSRATPGGPGRTASVALLGRGDVGQASSRIHLRGDAALSLLGRTTHTRAPQPLGLNNRAGAIHLVPATHGAGLLPRRVPATADGGGAVQHVAARASSHTRVPLPVPVERAGQRREWWRRDALPQSHVPKEEANVSERNRTNGVVRAGDASPVPDAGDGHEHRALSKNAKCPALASKRLDSPTMKGDALRFSR